MYVIGCDHCFVWGFCYPSIPKNKNILTILISFLFEIPTLSQIYWVVVLFIRYSNHLINWWRIKKDTYCPKYPKVFHIDLFLNLIPVQYIFEYADWARYGAPGLYCKSTVFTNCNILDDVSFQIFFLCEHFPCFLYFLTRVWQVVVKGLTNSSQGCKWKGFETLLVISTPGCSSI